MFSRAFTMVELIFVIVILGILAAVAIPKLAATRDDAKESKICQNIATCITDAEATYTAKGSVTLSNIDSCASTDVSSLVSLNTAGDELTVSGAPAMCTHLDTTYILGGTRVSV